MPIPYTAFTAAVLALLFIALASRISQLRMRTKTSLGEGESRELFRIVRAHANLAEFAPVFLFLLLGLELAGVSGVALASLAGVFLLARFAHAAGLMHRATSPARQLGAGVSYLLIVIAAVWLLLALL